VTSPEETIAAILAADTWDKRVGEIRLIPERHGIAQHTAIFAAIARERYVPQLAADFAYVPHVAFYDEPHFEHIYSAAYEATKAFTKVAVDDIAALLQQNPQTLLVFRTMTGLLKNELAPATAVVAEQLADGSRRVPASTIDGAEKRGGRITAAQARVLAHTIDKLVRRELYTDAAIGWHSKQEKFDTRDGWDGVHALAVGGVPYSSYLHQRHFGGPFNQVTNATTSSRGDLLEDAVQQLFDANGVPYVQTGGHNQGDIAARFGVTVTPAPDFVVYDASDTLRAMLECKFANDGGTARDKANRFQSLQGEGKRLGGVPVIGVLGGTGWARVNDTLGSVLQHTDGRVFTVETLDEMLTVTPFPQLIGIAHDM
jgi:hypothetical protein